MFGVCSPLTVGVQVDAAEQILANCATADTEPAPPEPEGSMISRFGGMAERFKAPVLKFDYRRIGPFRVVPPCTDISIRYPPPLTYLCSTVLLCAAEFGNKMAASCSLGVLPKECD